MKGCSPMNLKKQLACIYTNNFFSGLRITDAVWVALLAALGILTPLNALALAYFSNFLCNTIQSWALPGRRLRLFSLGLTLFLCCDICVGVFNSPGIAPGWLEHFSGIGMWLFYLPGQVLIALSALPDAVLRGHDYENQ